MCGRPAVAPVAVWFYGLTIAFTLKLSVTVSESAAPSGSGASGGQIWSSVVVCDSTQVVVSWFWLAFPLPFGETPENSSRSTVSS
jgi:hypothetical protein